MRDIEGIDSVVEQLKPHWGEIDAHFESENVKFKRLIEQDHNLIGRVLAYHLMIEHYMDEYLSKHYKNDAFKNIRLSFFQKSELLPSSASAAAFVKPGIACLNKIRNKFGHELDQTIDFSDLQPILDILTIVRRGVKFTSPIEAIHAFTTVACTWLIVAPPHLQEIFSEAFSQIRVNTASQN